MSIKRQRGITLVGFMVTLALLGMVAFFAMRLIPAYMEFNGVKSALAAMGEDEKLANRDASTIKRELLKRLDMNYAESIEPSDITVTRISDGWNVAVDYEVRRPLLGNAAIVLSFDAEQDITSGRGSEE